MEIFLYRITSISPGGGGDVSSVNGETGAVVLDAVEIDIDTTAPWNDTSVTETQGALDYLKSNKQDDLSTAGEVHTLGGTFTSTPNPITPTESTPDFVEIDITRANNTATIDEATTLTFSDAPASGQTFGIEIENGGSQTYTLTFDTTGVGGSGTTPDLYSINLQSNRTTFDLSASATVFVSFRWNGSVLLMYGDPVEESGQTGTFASPSTTNPLAPTWEGLMHTVYYGATGEIDLPTAVGYEGRGILIYNTGAFTITIDPNGTETIVLEGTEQSTGATISLSSGAGNYVALISDGASWITLGYAGTLS